MLSEGHVETEVEVHVCISDGNKLGSHAEELVVASDEEVESAGMEVEHPAEGRSE